VRVPDLVAHNPVFLVVEVDGEEQMVGTGFVIGVKSETIPKTTHGYLVTARHCVEMAKRYGPLGVRVNRRRNPGPVTRTPDNWEVDEAETFGPPDDGWLYHDDPANDVAVIPFMLPHEEYMFVVIEHESCATADVVERERIGIGDELVIVGLFSSHYGRRVNRPIIRTGVIAAMPDEPMRDPVGGLSYDAYLAEVRSVGGLSGSPVWMIINPGRVMPGSHIAERRLEFYLLGLIRGHWKKEGEWLADGQTNETEILNTGIAIVTPIQAALDIIDSEAEAQRRRRVDEEDVMAKSP
jgi:hypothetical protein